MKVISYILFFGTLLTVFGTCCKKVTFINHLCISSINCHCQRYAYPIWHQVSANYSHHPCCGFVFFLSNKKERKNNQKSLRKTLSEKEHCKLYKSQKINFFIYELEEMRVNLQNYWQRLSFTNPYNSMPGD